MKILKKLPRSRLYRIIRKGEVRVNKKRVKPEYKLCAGDLLRIPPLKLEAADDDPVEISMGLLQHLEDAILFENDAIIVLNKPSGLAVHSGSGLRYGVIDAFRKLRHETDIELVHRLDRDTSGCLLLAKNRPALLTMQKQLQTNQIRKAYTAITRGYWDKSVSQIDLPLLRQTMPNGERKVFVDENGQTALTVIDEARHLSINDVRFSQLTIRLVTGRTHQIRVHCQSQHHEIAGDQKYGDRKFNKDFKKLAGKRLMLHAQKLEIPESDHTKALSIHAPLPEEFMKLHQGNKNG